jgi:hypothetical protein
MSEVYTSPTDENIVIVELDLEDASLLCNFLDKANFISAIADYNGVAEELELKLKIILWELNYESTTVY